MREVLRSGAPYRDQEHPLLDRDPGRLGAPVVRPGLPSGPGLRRRGGGRALLRHGRDRAGLRTSTQRRARPRANGAGRRAGRRAPPPGGGRGAFPVHRRDPRRHRLGVGLERADAPGSAGLVRADRPEARRDARPRLARRGPPRRPRPDGAGLGRRGVAAATLRDRVPGPKGLRRLGHGGLAGHPAPPAGRAHPRVGGHHHRRHHPPAGGGGAAHPLRRCGRALQHPRLPGHSPCSGRDGHPRPSRTSASST